MNTWETRAIKAIAIALVAFTTSYFSRAEAQRTYLGPTVSMDSLTNSSLSVDAGDKQFSNFYFSSDTIDPTQLQVTPFSGGFGLGLLFSCSNVTAYAGQNLDFVLGFSVTVMDPSNAISQLALGMTAQASGDAFVQITEQVYDSQAQYAGQLVTDTSSNSQAYLSFATPQHSLSFVTKDVMLYGGTPVAVQPQFAEGPSATLTQFSQSFCQVPEPSSVTLVLGALAMGFVLLRVRRSS